MVIKCLWLLPVIFCLGCAKEHGKPVSTLDYVGIERERNTNLYMLRFISDFDLLTIFSRDESPVGGILRCSLAGGNDFSVEHVQRYTARGLIQTVALRKEGNSFEFATSLAFVESLNEGRSERTLAPEELKRLLADKSSVSCVYVFTAYGFKPYYSGVLRVPAADILREAGRE